MDPLLYESSAAEMLDTADMNDDLSVGQLAQFVQRSSYAGPPAAQRVQHLGDFALPLSEIGSGLEEFVDLALGQ